MADPELHAYYALDRERDRLGVGLGLLEFERTTELILRTIPEAPAIVADIGGGPGRYTDWLFELGYTVIHRDIVPHHVDQVRARYDHRVDTATGDARDIDLADASVDAVLFLGPLYHLPDATDRARSVAEAARICKPGGMVYAAAITRWAARCMGVLVERGYETIPSMLDRIDDVDATGWMPAMIDGSFTAYAHTPAEFRDELDTTELELLSLLAIEGIAAAFGAADVEARMHNDVDRTVLLDSLRAVEAVPDLMGASAHILATSRRR